MAHHPSFTELSTELPVTLILADTSAEAAWARDDASVLTEQERNYAQEFDAEAAVTWSAGRVVLRHVLGAHLDRDPAAIEIRLDSAGKPRHDECEFSVSRSRRLVLVAVADDPVGLDIEAVPERDVALEAVHLLHKDERAELEALSDEDFAAGFVRVWARTEAFLKALSTGLARDPGLDYIGAGPHPNSPHPDVDIHDLEAGIPDGHIAAIAFNR
ncbi:MULTISPECIES: 4'-phosphopantetheinyl transferase family protein [unclassified Brevibacterium]|uniref:4'-phosphopantetheinyl transferase family protein n=1 Tax=unclassified Brevibacterium TaxID=2614124 RepID=UPI001092A07E|nr:4'-phosphopantetheinyl transferase superfamily protein [Brevibacterium sp. S22]TGD33045.1 4'-phosphopantetheinyl transferase superfamily protein [Brevibacterium sp. S22]